MPKTIFVKMLNDEGKLRDSYCDYWKMVELWAYDTCLLGEIDYQSDNVYIYSPDDGNSRAAFTAETAQNRRCKIVLLQLEWPFWYRRDDQGNIINDSRGQLHGFEVPDYVDAMLVCDMYYYNLLRAYSTKNNYYYFFLGGHPDFGNPNYQKRGLLWDLCPLSYNIGSRVDKLDLLQKRGLTVAQSENCWGLDREFVLTNSRWGLHLQQNPMPFIAPQRFLLFASYGLPILTDYCEEPQPYWVFRDALLHFDPRVTSVMNKELCDEAVRYNFDLVRNFRTFRREVDHLVEHFVKGK